jgi:hypothetical protein
VNKGKGNSGNGNSGNGNALGKLKQKVDETVGPVPGTP